MSNSSILGGIAPRQTEGKDVDLLGPSDTSDSGSDVQGERQMPTAPDNAGEWGAVVSDGRADTDAGGTGERAGAGGEPSVDGADILPDRIISATGEEADLFDEAESIESDDSTSEDDATSTSDTTYSRRHV